MAKRDVWIHELRTRRDDGRWGTWEPFGGIRVGKPMATDRDDALTQYRAAKYTRAPSPKRKAKKR